MGWRAAWLAEIEPFPSAVLAHHYPDVPNLGDMTKIAALVESDNVPAPDVLVGGTPCQAFSVAGLRGGLSDERGQLTLEFVRLGNVIDEKRAAAGSEPSIIVWENVPGVLSSKDNAFGCFLAGLAGESEALVPSGTKWSNAGYVLGPTRAVAWRVLDAQYFGVAQRRRRVFVVASARADFDPASVLFEFEGVRRDLAPSREAREETAATSGAGAAECIGALTAKGPATYGAPEIDGGHVFAATVGALDTECGFQRGTHQSINSGHLLPVGFRLVSFGEYKGDGSASTMKARDWKDATDLAVAHVDVMPTMVSGGSTEASHNQMSGQFREGYVAPTADMQVRRLTPTERERLQGFPDSHTLLPGKAPDGPRYKALGNSMAVPCMAWIGRRIADFLHSIER